VSELRLVVLVSGRGSNLDALIEGVHQRADVAARIELVVSNRPGAAALARAHAGITSATVDHTRFEDRNAFEAALADVIDTAKPDAILLAGFMRVLTPGFVQRYATALLNIHPSLLPRHTGLDTHARALAAGDAEHGATVHMVTPEVDAGPAIARVRLPIRDDDSEAGLAARVLAGEHRLYPEVIRWLASGRLELTPAGPILDGGALPEGGVELMLDEERRVLAPC